MYIYMRACMYSTGLFIWETLIQISLEMHFFRVKNFLSLHSLTFKFNYP